MSFTGQGVFRGIMQASCDEIQPLRLACGCSRAAKNPSVFDADEVLFTSYFLLGQLTSVAGVMIFACCTSCGDVRVDEEKPTFVRPSVLATLEEHTFIVVVKGGLRNLITSLDISDPKCIIVKDVSSIFSEWNKNRRNEKVELYDHVSKVNGDPCSSRSLREGLQIDPGGGELYLTLRHPDERLVAFERSDYLGLDISFRKTLSVRPWVAKVSGGSLARWNAENPNLCVGPHDRILAINGVSGAPLEIVEKLKDPSSGYIYLTVLHYALDEEGP
eukprot:symbB.v1.2.010791.t1/scaffold710.1/size170492/2